MIFFVALIGLLLCTASFIAGGLILGSAVAMGRAVSEVDLTKGHYKTPDDLEKAIEAQKKLRNTVAALDETTRQIADKRIQQAVNE